MNNQGLQKLPKVVLIPAPFQGHISPMLELGAVLHSKGFSIIVAHTIFNSPNPSNHPNFLFLPITDNLSDCYTSPGNLLSLVKNINSNCEEPFRNSLNQIMDQEEPEHRVVCIIYDMVMYFSEAVAGQLMLPCISFRTSGVFAALAYNDIPRLVAEGHIPRKDNMLQDLVPGLFPLRFRDIPCFDMGSLEDVIKKYEPHEQFKKLFIWNTVDHLEQAALAKYQQQHPIQIFRLGPLHKMAPPLSTSLLHEDTSCITWLNKQAPRSVMYVSVGSLAFMEEKELNEMAWGLAISGQPFLWVLRNDTTTSDSETKWLPEGFEELVGERGCIVKWAPQRKVLAHHAVGGFWSHCCWNSTLESLSEGVPMICWPCFGDQKINARYLSDFWNVGELFEHELERESIKQAIRRLIVDKELESNRKNALLIKDNIRLGVNKGGWSYDSLNDLAELIMSFQQPK